MTNNGYSIPEEAFAVPTPDDFSFVNQGYINHSSTTK